MFSLSCETLFGTLQVQSVTCYRNVHEAFFYFLGEAFVQPKKCNCSVNYLLFNNLKAKWPGEPVRD